MKNHLFFALLLASALCGCSSSQVDEPISVEPFSQKSVFNVSQPAHDDYKSCVKEHPEIFGANCMFFETEEDMLEMYDKVLEMSCTDFKEWAENNSLNNEVVNSNFEYYNAIEEAEKEFKESFDASNDVVAEMCKVLYTRFSSLSDYVVSFNEGGICYYVPKEPLSIGVFANDNNLFVVDSLVYLCVSSNIMSFPFELDSLRSFGEFLHYAKDTSIYSKIIDYNHNQEPWYPLRTDIDYPWRSYFLRNGDHAAKVTIRTIENLRMHGAVRTITANVQSFHIHDGCATLSNCFGKVDGEVTTYNEVRENVFTDHFRKGNRLMKDYSFTIACHNVDSARSSYVNRNLLQINFSNTHGVHGEYKP